MSQARAIGIALSPLPITAIFCSPLRRAHDTALQIFERQDPAPRLEQSDLLKEQYFGSLEGQPWAGFRSDSGSLSSLSFSHDRAQKFPGGGESRDDVAARASRALDQFLMPHIVDGKGLQGSSINVVIVSHGIFISELIGEILRRSPCGQGGTWKSGLVNTGWTRLLLGLEEEANQWEANSSSESAPFEGAATTASTPSSHLVASDHSPRLFVRVTATNQISHLDGLKRQRGGIGSAMFDAKQRSLHDFFRPSPV